MRTILTPSGVTSQTLTPIASRLEAGKAQSSELAMRILGDLSRGRQRPRTAP